MLISDESINGRFHFHGVIEFDNIQAVETLRRKLTKTYGKTKVKAIDDTVKWANYCTAQYTEDGKKGVHLKMKKAIVISNTI